PCEAPIPLTIRPFRRLPPAYFSGFWLLMILLALSSEPARANGSRLRDPISHQDFRRCTSIQTFAKKGSWVSIWYLIDFHQSEQLQQLMGISSSKTRKQFDCANKSLRSRSVGSGLCQKVVWQWGWPLSL